MSDEPGPPHTAIALVSPAERGEPAAAAPALAGRASSTTSGDNKSAASASSSASSSPSSASSPSSSSSDSSSSAESSSEEDSSSAASSSPASSSAASSSPASSYAPSSPGASALEEGKQQQQRQRRRGGAGVDLPGTPHSGKTLDSDISTLPTTPFRQSCLCRCLGWSFLLLAVLGLIVGVLVQQRVLWFVMPKVDYEKGGSAFQLSTTGPAGEIDGIQYATDFYMTIGVKVDNPNNYALTFSDVSMGLTDFRGAYVGTASHEAMVTVPARKSRAFTLDAEIHTTLPEVILIAKDCERNGMTTDIKAAGSLRAQIIPNVISFPIKMGPYKTSINCAVNGPDGKPLIGADGHIRIPDHLQDAATETPATDAPAAHAPEAPAAVAVDGAGNVAIDPAPAAPADGGAPPADPGKDTPQPPPAEGAGGGGGGGEAPPAPPAPPAGNNNNNNGGGVGGGWLMRNVFGWGN